MIGRTRPGMDIHLGIQGLKDLVRVLMLGEGEEWEQEGSGWGRLIHLRGKEQRGELKGPSWPRWNTHLSVPRLLPR